jgi:4-hydroxy-tetrahydrodipicolinate synthase
MVTPFDTDGALDLDGAVALARWLTEHGSDGLVLAGSTGEGSVLDDQEKLDLWRAVAEAVTVPVIAASGSNDTRHSIELTAQAADCGVDGVLVVTPYYNKPSATGIYQHFEAVAAATPLPMVVYDIPSRSVRRIGTENLVKMAHEVPNIVGVKDALGEVAATAHLMARIPSDFELYSGDDIQTLPLLALGAVGVISVASHWAGREMGQVIDLFGKGDHAGAREVNARLLESFDFESNDDAPNPLPAKAAMRALGLSVGECRLPMGAGNDALNQRARQVLSNLGIETSSGQPVA